MYCYEQGVIILSSNVNDTLLHDILDEGHREKEQEEEGVVNRQFIRKEKN